MIPKQLFFIWLGDNKPNYVDFAVNTFKDVNPDFKVNLIEYSVNDIENIDKISKSEYDSDVSRVMQYILDKNSTKYKYHRNQFYNKHRKFIQTIANILRCEILNRYGGIYLDCDTFPLKPFDDFILNKKQFTAFTFPSFDSSHRHRDNFFMGKAKDDSFIYDCYGIFEVVPTSSYKRAENGIWVQQRNDFYDCKLKYSEMDTEYYIEHFVDRTWKMLKGKCRSPICKYDKITK